MRMKLKHKKLVSIDCYNFQRIYFETVSRIKETIFCNTGAKFCV